LREYHLKVEQYRKSQLNRPYKRKGEITVFLAMLSIVMCGFIYVIIHGAKITASKLKIEAITELALDSAMSEYNKELWDKFGLLYVDCNYKGISDGREESFLTHLASYVDVNVTGTSDILYLSSEITDICWATDNNYESFKEQIRECVKVGQYISDEEVLDSYIIDHKDLYVDIIDELVEYRVSELRAEYYGETGNDELPDFYEIVDGDEEFKRYLSETDYEEKLILLINNIEAYMRETSYGKFDFDNLLYSATVTVYMEGPEEKTYECTRFITLRGGRS